MKFSTSDVYRNVLGDYEFHENRYSESPTLLRGESTFLSLLSAFIVWFWLNEVYQTYS
jgi:hypothetical protein